MIKEQGRRNDYQQAVYDGQHDSFLEWRITDEAANILYIGGRTLYLPPIVNSPSGKPIIRRTSITATTRRSAAPIIELIVDNILFPLRCDLLRISAFIKNECIGSFIDHFHHLIDAFDIKPVESYPSVKVDTDMKYAMLPAWFITFRYKDKPHTILVNGDTGKVVCALPWKKALFDIMLLAIAITASVLSFFVFKEMFTSMFASGRDLDKGDIRILLFIIVGIGTLFSTGIGRVKRVMENIRLTQDKAMFNFTKKRQG